MAEEISIDRVQTDFEYWARHCVTIRDKISGRDVPLVLNKPQRKLLAVLERQRKAGQPLRVIILKARQWGGSTMVQAYMAWIQLVHRENWNSIICAHLKDTSATLRAMYSKILDNYPKELLPDGKPLRMKSLKGSLNTLVLEGRGSRVTLGTAESQEASRGQDLQMAHLSEVAFWKRSPLHSPSDLVRAICSGIPMEPYTLVVLESTANGVGSFFHREWVRACRGESDKAPLFVAWHEIEMYTVPCPSPAEVEAAMTDYERDLQKCFNLSIEQIAWYLAKKREYPDHRSMMAEYPSTPEEAFNSTNNGVFCGEHLDRLRSGCQPPAFVGEIERDGQNSLNNRSGFVPDPRGLLEVWRMPAEGTRYVVTVDVGGRSEKADFSVVCVMSTGAIPEVVAQWRGHGDHDLLGRRAARIAQWYNNALLVIESNTLETAAYGGGETVLDTLQHRYANLYMRHGENGHGTWRPGFHTNVRTKALAIAALITAVREGLYIERSHLAVDEMATYEQLPNGAYAARDGNHDDVLMTRAIALSVLDTERDTSTANVSQKITYW